MSDIISRDEAQAEYQRLGPLPASDVGYTTKEYAKEWRVDEQAARRIIKRFLDAGLAVHGRKPYLQMNQISRMTDCYKIVLPAAKGKKK